MGKHTQAIRRQFANEMFECVWLFCDIGVWNVKKRRDRLLKPAALVYLVFLKIINMVFFRISSKIKWIILYNAFLMLNDSTLGKFIWGLRELLQKESSNVIIIIFESAYNLAWCWTVLLTFSALSLYEEILLGKLIDFKV